MPTKESYARNKERNKKRFKLMDHTAMDNITKIVCDVFNVSFQDIKGEKKNKPLVIARQTIAFFARFEEQKLWYMAMYLGYQEHGVVKHGIKQVEDTLLNDKEYVKKFNMVSKRITEKDITQYTWEKIKTVEDLNNFY